MLNNTTDNSKSPINDVNSQGEDEIDLATLLGTLLDSKWLILSVTSFVLFVGAGKAFIDTPIYKTDVMLQVQEHSKSSLLEGLGDMAELMETKKPILAEIELLKSRMILGETIKNLKLNITAKPKYFPLVGAAVARRFKSSPAEQFATPFFAQASDYAWGGKKSSLILFLFPKAG